ncbi:MAG: DUF402 domain-containing protein [Euryarchaeota archaeon]|nr:DUF402 domain-containing protein [Euryarchaeota archaeon]
MPSDIQTSINSPLSVMVRGIYATALTKIFLDNGIPVSNPSRVIQERFGDVFSLEPPKAMVLHNKNMNSLLVQGEKELVEKVVEILRKELKFSAYIRKWSVRPIYKMKILSKEGGLYKVEINGETYELFSRRKYTEGDYTLGSPVGSLQSKVLSDEVSIQGKYVVVYLKEGEVKFGKAIKSQKEDLEKLMSMLDRANLEIFVKDSAEKADLTEVLEETQNCVNRALEIIKKAEKIDTGLVDDGEYYYEILISLPDMLKLDEVRSLVVPTISYHHLIKSMGDAKYSYIVDLLEKGGAPREVGKYLYKGIIKSSKEKTGGPGIILHRKLSGEVHVMRGFVRKFDENTIEIGRFIKSSGTYDGLNVPREPGDYVITTIPMNRWWLRHEYYSSKGVLKGIYYNVNTPPEVLANAIRYIDLEVDVVLWPTGEYKVIEMEELESAYDMGIVSEEMILNARKAIKEIEEDIKKVMKEKMEKKEVEDMDYFVK